MSESNPTPEGQLSSLDISVIVRLDSDVTPSLKPLNALEFDTQAGEIGLAKMVGSCGRGRSGRVTHD